MPTAARSTSAQFKICPSPSQGARASERERERNHRHTHSPSGVFVFLFVSICSKSGTWHLLGETPSPTEPRGLSHVWMQTNSQHSKLIKVGPLNFTVQYPPLRVITHTHTHTPVCTVHPSADKIFQKVLPSCFHSLLKFSAGKTAATVLTAGTTQAKADIISVITTTHRCFCASPY